MKVYYEFCLEDYAAPSCTSGYKFYYGTKDDLKVLLNNLKKEKQISEIDVFKEFLNGNDNVENVAGFCKVRFAKIVNVLLEKEITAKETFYDYINPYDCHYYLRFDEMKSKRILIKSEEGYAVAHKTILTNPKYQGVWEPTGWVAIDMLWGFPEMINIKGDVNCYTAENLLFIMERTFKSEKEAREYFDNTTEIDFQMFFEDVFGDG